MATKHAHPIPSCAVFGFLHVVSAPAPITSLVPPATVPPAPVPVAVIPITPPAAFHPVSIIVLSRSAGQCQTPKTENKQQTKNYDSL